MSSSAAPIRVRIENHPIAQRVLGIGEARPRLSWVTPQADEGWVQQAYELEVVRAEATATYVVESNEQLYVAWPGGALHSREQATVRIRVRDDSWSPWSEPVEIEVGLLDADDWSTSFVSPTGTIGAVQSPAPLVHGTWELPNGIVQARLYASAHGIYEFTLNGARVGDELFSPGWTSYANRLRYQTFDVSEMVSPGTNSASVVLGNGWYRGQLSWNMGRCHYGDRLALLAQLEVVTADGQRHVFSADEQWTASESGIISDDIYDGQITDLQGSANGEVVALEAIDSDMSVLIAADGPPVRATEIVPAVAVWRSPTGKLLVDFGQNLVGWCRLTVRDLGVGDAVVIRHAEVLENDELGVRPLRKAKATDTYYVSGADEEVLEPCFTFHGFRYAEVSGVDDLDASDIQAVVIHSDMERTGWFESSHELLNRLHDNVIWGMRGNFLDVPTDCPQRDERLGWTGDIQVFSPTASFLFDSGAFLQSWLKDLAFDQRSDGGVPVVIPDVLHDGMVAAAWGDAATLVPWALYQRSGDLGVLARQLPSMHAWVRCVHQATTNDIWAGGFQFGDWLDPTAPPDDALRSKADKDVVATAHLVRSAEVLAKAARLVGDDDIAGWAEGVAARALAGFRKEFVTPSGRVLSDAQTVYALALQWDLLETEQQRQVAAARLADLVRSAGFTIATGFVGTPVITDALASNGYADVAYRMLLETACPSWLYPVTMGATTVWERWDSMMVDGSINPGEMTSFNHYALGAVADWMHRCVAGLAPLEPAYRRLRIAPVPGRGLDSAHARFRSPYGLAEAGWTREGDSGVVVMATIPVGATAEVVLPDGSRHDVGHGAYRWSVKLAGGAAGPPATVRQLVDDPLWWQRLVDAANEAGRAIGRSVEAKGVADRLGPFLNLPVAVLPDVLTLGGSIPGREFFVEALGELIAPFDNESDRT